MDKLNLSGLFEAVPVDRELPDVVEILKPKKITKFYQVKCHGGSDDIAFYNYDKNKWFDCGYDLIEVTHWLRPVTRESIEAFLRKDYETMYKAGVSRGLAGYGINKEGTKYDMEMHITELINKTLGQ